MGKPGLAALLAGWRAKAQQMGGSVRSRLQPNPRPVSLYRRLVLNVTLLALAAVLLGGLPAVGLLWLDFDRQVQSRIQDGQSATKALFEAERDRWIEGITLVAKRPTLCALISGGDAAALLSYLETLRLDTPADTLWVVLPSGETVSAGDSQLVELTQLGEASADFVTLHSPPALVILAASPVETSPGCRATVAAVERLDDAFMHRLAQHTGLEQSLIVAGSRSATSLAEAPAWALDARAAEQVAQTLSACCTQARSRSQRYYVGLAPLLDRRQRLVAISEVALPGNAILGRFILILGLVAGSGLLLAGGSAIAAASMTRRILQPLRELAQAAESIGAGDLDQPLPTHSAWLEIDQLAARLDESRLRLRTRLEISRREARRFALLLNAVPQGIVTLNEVGLVTWLNPDAEHLLGCRLAGVLRQPYTQIFRPAPGADLEIGELVNDPAEMSPPRRLHLLDAAGRPLALAVSAAWLDNEQPAGVRRERVLILQETSQEEAVSRLRAEFLASLAHEFRTPPVQHTGFHRAAGR